ncbi:MAG: transposase [Anaerolineae bacterium]|nr:transposase [Anaerolineae bacterium]MCI0607825.1 transposase [Anaerolineae bacterium]
MPDIKYRRNLPHIHPEGYPLFITFRLADSLPTEVLAELKAQRERELNSKPNLSSSERYDIERRFFKDYDNWLDRCASGPRWLEDENIASIVSEKIQSMSGEYFQLFAYCILPNHVHLLIESIIAGRLHHRGKTAKYPVTDVMRLLKGGTARVCNLKLKRSGHFWNHESYDHYIRDERELERITKYILYNPVKAGLVEDWKKWQFTYVNPELGSW